MDYIEVNVRELVRKLEDEYGNRFSPEKLDVIIRSFIVLKYGAYNLVWDLVINGKIEEEHSKAEEILREAHGKDYELERYVAHYLKVLEIFRRIKLVNSKAVIIKVFESERAYTMIKDQQTTIYTEVVPTKIEDRYAIGVISSVDIRDTSIENFTYMLNRATEMLAQISKLSKTKTGEEH